MSQRIEGALPVRDGIVDKRFLRRGRAVPVGNHYNGTACTTRKTGMRCTPELINAERKEVYGSKKGQWVAQ